MIALGRWCFRHRRTVVVAWVVALGVLGLIAARHGGTFQNDFRVADSESQRALDRLRTSFPDYAGDPLAFVISADAGIEATEVRAAVEAALTEIGALEGVREVVSPYGPAAPVSLDRTTAIAQIRLHGFGPEVDPALVRNIIAIADRLTVESGVDAAVGGPTAMFAELERPGSREGLGVLLALAVLVLTFGSVVAAGLPIVVALGGLGAGLGLVLLLTRVVEVTTFAPGMAAMIGLGVGIDYALFILTRYRQELRAGLEAEDAAAVAVATSGRAVVLAGSMVVASLLGMLLVGVSMVIGLAIGAAIAVACTVVAAVTLMPAALGFAGGYLDRFAVPFGRERHGVSGGWHRWSRWVQRRPWPALVGSVGLLLLLASPALGLELGGPHYGSGPETHSSRRAYDAITRSFGEGFNGPLVLVAEIDPGDAGDLLLLDQLAARIRVEPGVALVLPPIANAGGDVAALTVIPSTAPHSVSTQALVHRLRGVVVPGVTGTADLEVSVSGVTALFADMADLLNQRLPLFIGAVLLVSVALLLVVFQSVVVPLKAALMNVLSIAAAYGVVVAVFQWGWGAGLVGADRPGPIMAFIPIMLFAILFGLSMDYEVFLLSRIREEYERTGDNALAVADGLAATGRVITAAAAIMVLIFSSFVLGDDPIIKTFGVGLAVAVLVDATVVRLVLVPAAMELLGNANWWFPARLHRWLPRLELERVDSPSGRSVGELEPRVLVSAAVREWLATLPPRERGRAVALLDAVSTVDGETNEVELPLGRRRRRLGVSVDDSSVLIDLRRGGGGDPVDWCAHRSALLGDVEAVRGYGVTLVARRIGEALRARRELLGLEVDEVARRCGMDGATLEAIEAGRIDALERAVEVCAELGAVLEVQPAGEPPVLVLR